MHILSNGYNEGMNRNREIKIVEARLRASLEYGKWVERNLTSRCVRCPETAGLQVHHIGSTFHLILGLWNLYGDWDAVFNHAVAMHSDDRVESVTMCHNCHGTMHPLRGDIEDTDFRTDKWTTLPRILDLHFAPGTKNLDGISLVTFQTLMGLGWHILSGNMESKIIQTDRRTFAKLIGKTPGTSFNTSLHNALECLASHGIVLAYIVIENEVEVHMAPEYLERLGENPWFFSMEDAKTSSMTTLCFRWLLSFHGNKRKVSFGIEKLSNKMGLTTKRNSFIIKAVGKACEDTPWIAVKPRTGILDFELARRGAIPIRSLRKALSKALERD